MKKLINFLGLVIALNPIILATHVKANVDYSLLVGEWAEKGECSTERTVFTQDGRYIWLKNQDGNWMTQYSAFRKFFNESKLLELQRDSPKASGAISIEEFKHLASGGEVIDIHELTQNKIIGEWNVLWSDGLSFENPNDAFFTWFRCQRR